MENPLRCFIESLKARTTGASAMNNKIRLDKITINQFADGSWHMDHTVEDGDCFYYDFQVEPLIKELKSARAMLDGECVWLKVDGRLFPPHDIGESFWIGDSSKFTHCPFENCRKRIQVES